MIVRRVIVSVPDVASSFSPSCGPFPLRGTYIQAAPILPSALRPTRFDWNGFQNVLEASTAGGPLPAAKVMEDRVVGQQAIREPEQTEPLDARVLGKA